MALQVAAQVGLTLDCCGAPTEPTDVWLKRATAVQQALITRGAQPTSLSVLCTLLGASKVVRDAGLARLSRIPEHLSGAAGLGVTDLKLDTLDAAFEGTFDGLLQALTLHTPNLVTLHLKSSPCALPPPSSLPSLRVLSLWHRGQDRRLRPAAYRSIAQYMTQLTSLSIDECDSWSVLLRLTSKEATHTLTEFSTDQQLTIELLTALLDHAPALKQLAAGAIRAGLGNHSNREWGLERLTVRYMEQILVRLGQLPRCKAGGQVTIKGESEVGILTSSSKVCWQYDSTIGTSHAREACMLSTCIAQTASVLCMSACTR